MTGIKPYTCGVCGHGDLVSIPEYASLPRVTSDCRSWEAGGTLCTCPECGAVQKPPDEKWLDEIERIYSSYEIYFQSGGAEQPVFDGTSGAANPRSAALLERFFAAITIDEAGRLLDIGCGNGALLRQFNRLRPAWTLFGNELGETHRAEIESIPGVERFIAGDPHDTPGSFDLITMIHALEHFPAPDAVLGALQDKIERGGHLLIEVPNNVENPFDLLIADHRLHFTSETLTRLLGRSGYRAVSVATDWIAKELSAVAYPGATAESEMRSDDAGKAASDAAARVDWLHAMLAAARHAAKKEPFGIFGTSIAANWLFGTIADSVAFFVDEDPARVGMRHFGRPVFDPENVPAGATVFMALPPQIAASIASRVGRPGIDLRLPPPLP